MSVIVPVGDRTHLDVQLDALAAQTFPGAWELILANNRDDAPLVIDSGALPARVEVRTVDASGRPGPSYARNVGAAAARGDLLAFCDADDAVAPEWLEHLARAAVEADLVAGRLDAEELNTATVARWRPRRPDHAPTGKFLPVAPSSNLAIWRSVFEELHGFDERYPKAQDVELSWRAQLCGFSFGFAADAVVRYRYRSTHRGAFRQAVRSGRASVQLHRDFAVAGHPGRPASATLRDWAWLVTRLPFLVTTRHRRGIWVRRAGEALGRVIGSVRFREIYL